MKNRKPVSRLVAEKKARKKARREGRLVMSVPEAGARLDMSPSSAYAAAKRGDIPTIRIGHLLKVPVIRFERMLAGEEGAQ